MFDGMISVKFSNLQPAQADASAGHMTVSCNSQCWSVSVTEKLFD